MPVGRPPVAYPANALIVVATDADGVPDLSRSPTIPANPATTTQFELEMQPNGDISIEEVT